MSLKESKDETVTINNTPDEIKVTNCNDNDTISRQAAIEALDDEITITGKTNAVIVQDYIRRVNNRLHDLPSAQPEIIRCRNCKFASGDSRICMKFGHSPIGELDFCAWAERRTDE